MATIGGLEIILIIVLLVIIYLVIGPKRIGRLLRVLGKGFSLSGILATIGLVMGYILGSKILPILSFTSWERYVVGNNSSNYTSNLQSAYSDTALIGGIVGAIVFFVIGLVVARLIKK